MTGLTKAAIGSMQAANKKGTNDIGGSHTLWVPINYVLALGNHALLYPSSTYDTHTHTHIHTYIHTVLGTASNRIQKMTLKSWHYIIRDSILRFGQAIALVLYSISTIF